MSLPTITGTAQLLTEVKKALTKDGKPMATALLKFAAWRKVDGKWVEGDSVVASAIAFEDTARALAGFAKGDNVAVTATGTVGVWQDKPRLNLRLTGCQAPAAKGSTEQAAGNVAPIRSEASERLARTHESSPILGRRAS